MSGEFITESTGKLSLQSIVLIDTQFIDVGCIPATDILITPSSPENQADRAPTAPPSDRRWNQMKAN